MLLVTLLDSSLSDGLLLELLFTRIRFFFAPLIEIDSANPRLMYPSLPQAHPLRLLHQLPQASAAGETYHHLVDRRLL